MCLLTKIEITRWTEFFQERVEAIVQSKVMLAISVAKINDRTGFKDDSSNKQASFRNKKNKIEHWGVHIETTKEQQVQVKRAICDILAHQVPSWMNVMELKFMSHMRYDMDSKHK